MKVFGVGCITFGYKVDDQKSYDGFYGQKFPISEIKSRLESVENVSSITIVSDESETQSFSIVEKRDYSIVVPMFHGARVEFDIFIPFRVQDAVYRRCDVEKVHVDLIWGYEMPLAIISYEWPDEEGEASPSGAVVAVRKYLEKKLTGAGFICDCVGPSPFHANFVLVETELNDGVRLEDVSVDRLSYASLELIAPRGVTLLDALSAAHLDSTLSKFYHLSELRSRAIHAHTEIIETSKQLLKREAPAGIRGRISAMRQEPNKVDNLNNNVFDEMLIRLEMSGSISDSEQYQLIGDGRTMDYFFSEFRRMSGEESWSKFYDIAKFFEERHQKAIGNITSVVAGVIGGIIGSVIGSLVTYLLTRG